MTIFSIKVSIKDTVSCKVILEVDKLVFIYYMTTNKVFYKMEAHFRTIATIENKKKTIVLVSIESFLLVKYACQV